MCIRDSTEGYEDQTASVDDVQRQPYDGEESIQSIRAPVDRSGGGGPVEGDHEDDPDGEGDQGARSPERVIVDAVPADSDRDEGGDHHPDAHPEHALDVDHVMRVGRARASQADNCAEADE